MKTLIIGCLVIIHQLFATSALADTSYILKEMRTKIPMMTLKGNKTGKELLGTVIGNEATVKDQGVVSARFPVSYNGFKCQMDLFFGWGFDTQSTHAAGVIHHCRQNSNNAEMDLACNLMVEYVTTGLRGRAFCNAYQPGDTYNAVNIRWN